MMTIQCHSPRGAMILTADAVMPSDASTFAGRVLNIYVTREKEMFKLGMLQSWW